jgi:hypothetical protein
VFGHKADPSRIFTYKCKVPHDGLDVAEEQLRLARRYKNRLIELELGRHAPRVAEAERRIAGLTPRVEEAERAVKLRKQDKHRRVADGAPTRAEATAALKALRAELKAARADRRRYRAEEFEGNAGLAADLTVLEADHAAALREARRVASKEWGLYWATYLVREQAARANRKGAPPVFRRWDGTGAIAVQLQNGLAVPDLLAGGDSRLRLGLAAVGRGPRGPIPADPTSNRSRSKRWATVAFRAGTGPDGRSPIWVRATVRVHRPPPAGAAVKWAYLRRVVAGVHARWELQLVLADPAGWDPGDQADAGAAGLDLGWRRVRGGLRVAYLAGDDGRREDLVLPDRLVAAWEKADAIRSLRDREFDAARAAFAAWLAGRAVPDWLAEAAARLGSWKSPRRLAALARRWAEGRFEGDDDAHAALAAWRARERHLDAYEAGVRAGAIRLRDDIYRKFAARLRRAYRTVRVEAIDWGELQRRAAPEGGDEAVGRHLFRVAAVGRLVQLVGRSVAELERVPPALTTLACHACGHVDRFDAARELVHTCSACGEAWDQDQNAAINILRSGVAPRVPG